MTYRHAFVVPLVGGQAIAQAQALGSAPEFLESWDAFAANDAHLRAYWPGVPYHSLDAARHVTQNVPVQTARDAAVFVRDYLDGRLVTTSTLRHVLVFDNCRQRVFSAPLVM